MIQKTRNDKSEKIITQMNKSSNMSNTLKIFKQFSSKKRTPTPTLINNDGSMSITELEKAQSLAIFFTNVVKYLSINKDNWSKYICFIRELLQFCNVDTTQKSFNKYTIRGVLIILQEILKENHQYRKTIIDVMPNIESLVEATWLYLTTNRHSETEEEFKRFIYDINFNHSFKTHIEKQVNKFVNKSKTMRKMRMNEFNLMMNAVITVEETKKVIKRLKMNKSAGPDKIYNEMFINANDDLIVGVTAIFNKCLSRGEFPKSLKDSIVAALYKKKSPHVCNNYRPIKLLSVIGKIYERIIANRLQPYLKEKLFSKSQAGFRLKFSTEEQIIFVIEEIRMKLADSQNCTCIP